jgi:ABC-2 type transport system ATP-binding protein
MSNIVLEVNKLSKHYGKLKAVDEISFSFEKGEVYGILGPNGSGKTTTLAMLSEVIRPTNGSFSWFDTKYGSNQRRKIGVMLEKPNFYEYMSALDNLKIVADIRKGGHQDIDDILKKVGLFDRRNSRFKTFSLGMKQRLAIGAALLGNPDVLIFDEPTNGLDPEGIAEVRSLIKQLASQDKTIILASHLLDEVQKVCTQILVLRKGVKIFQGNVNGLPQKKKRINLRAQNMDELASILSKSESYCDFEVDGNIIRVVVNESTTTSDLNKYLFSKGIVASHLAYKKESLEENIFELLKDTK